MVRATLSTRARARPESPQPLHRLSSNRAAGLIGYAPALHAAIAEARVADPLARQLQRARPCHACCRLCAALTACGRGELLRGHARQLDVHVEPVEQRAGDAHAVVSQLRGRAAAKPARLAPLARTDTDSWRRRAERPPGTAACSAARDTAMMPVSSGSRSASSTARLNSGSSSRNNTPWCARLISPGRARAPAADECRGRGAVVWRAEGTLAEVARGESPRR